MISLDFFKAYDRVFIGYLLEVMKRMKFGAKFCAWIKMLHQGAKTRLILGDLTEAINVSFLNQAGRSYSNDTLHYLH